MKSNKVKKWNSPVAASVTWWGVDRLFCWPVLLLLPVKLNHLKRLRRKDKKIFEINPICENEMSLQRYENTVYLFMFSQSPRKTWFQSVNLFFHYFSIKVTRHILSDCLTEIDINPERHNKIKNIFSKSDPVTLCLLLSYLLVYTEHMQKTRVYSYIQQLCEAVLRHRNALS